jgi:hypothetical protein
VLHIRVVKLEHVKFGEEQELVVIRVFKTELNARVLEIELTLYLQLEFVGAVFLVDCYVGDFLLVFDEEAA